MIVQCPSCSSRYRVNSANIPSSGGKIKCPSCAHAFVVYPEQEQHTEMVSSSAFNDATSIAQRPDLRQLMQGFGSVDDDDPSATQVVPNASSMDFGLSSDTSHPEEDGTVEMQNPLAFIKKWESQNSSEEYDDDDPNTEIISADMMVFDDYLVEDSMVEDDYEGYDATQIAPSNAADAFLASAYDNATTEAPLPFMANAQPGTPAGNPPSFSNQPGVAPGQPSFLDKVNGAPDHSYDPSNATIMDPYTAPSVNPFGPPEQPAPGVPSPSGPNPAHQGPWRMQVSGMVYDFGDLNGLHNWLSTQRETSGLRLAADVGDFYELSQWPQVQTQPNRSALNRPNMSTGPLGQAPAQMSSQPQSANNLPSFGTQPMSAGQQAAPQPGFAAPQSGFAAPQQGFAAPTNKSGDVWSKLLWVLFILFFIGALVVGLELAGILNLRQMLLGTSGGAMP